VSAIGANLSLLKSSKVKGVRFETLDKICAALECQPGDLLEHRASWPTGACWSGEPRRL